MSSLLEACDLAQKSTRFYMAWRFYSALATLRTHLSDIARRIESRDPTAIENAPEEIRNVVNDVMGVTPTIRFTAEEPMFVDATKVIRRTFEDCARGVFVGYRLSDFDALPVYEIVAYVDVLAMVVVHIMSFFLQRKTQDGYVDICVSFKLCAESDVGSIFFAAEVPCLTKEEVDGIRNNMRGAFGLENPLSVARFFAIDMGGELRVVDEAYSVRVEFQLPKRCHASV